MPGDGDVAGTILPRKLNLRARVANLGINVPVEELYYFALFTTKYNINQR